MNNANSKPLMLFCETLVSGGGVVRRGRGGRRGGGEGRELGRRGEIEKWWEEGREVKRGGEGREMKRKGGGVERRGERNRRSRVWR